MDEELPILPLLLASLVAFGFGYEVNRRKERLKAIFNVFDKQESKIATALEEMVRNGEILPFTPKATAAH